MNVSDIPSAAGGSTAPSATPLVSATDRVLALVDEVIGLKAELAAQQYRHDLALWAMEERAAEMEARTIHAEQRLDDVLASRSWRLGQPALRLAEVARRLRRRFSPQ